MDAVYFELNDWTPDTYYPDNDFFESLVEGNEDESDFGLLLNQDWVTKNKLIVVATTIDMSVNYCISASQDWVEKNCPELLNEYSKFLRPDRQGRYGRLCMEYDAEKAGIYAQYDDRFERWENND